MEFAFYEAKAGPGCEHSIFLYIFHYYFHDLHLAIWERQRIVSFLDHWSVKFMFQKEKDDRCENLSGMKKFKRPKFSTSSPPHATHRNSDLLQKTSYLLPTSQIKPWDPSYHSPTSTVPTTKQEITFDEKTNPNREVTTNHVTYSSRHPSRNQSE